MAAKQPYSPNYSGQLAQDLYVQVNAMLSSISELHESLSGSMVGNRDTAILLNLIEMKGSDLRELVRALRRLALPELPKLKD